MFLHKNVSIHKVYSAMLTRGTHLPDYKYKHMLENGGTPVKFGVLCCLFHIEFHGFKVYTKGFSDQCSTEGP